jgi:hypothetical protein
LVQNSMDILPRDTIITHDRFGNWVVQERIDGWFISWYQQATRQRRLFALTAHESPPRSSARYIGRVQMRGNSRLKNFTGVARTLVAHFPSVLREMRLPEALACPAETVTAEKIRAHGPIW